MVLSRSSYYYKPKRSTAKAEENERIVKRLNELAVEYSRYGYRRMTAQLKREGLCVNRKRVLRLMNENGIVVKTGRRAIVTTDSNHELRIYPNLYSKREIGGLNEAWVADMTYVRLDTGFCYLAVILDANSRKVIGWAMSKRIDTELTCTALKRAIELRNPPEGCIHHSDRGSQYAANEYIALLNKHKFSISMSRKGNPYDNAQAESFMKTIKTEEVYLAEYRDFEDAASSIGLFIESVYNKTRLHSALGYVPPAEYEVLLSCPKDTTIVSA